MRDNVLVYGGRGAGPFSLVNLVDSLRNQLQPYGLEVEAGVQVPPGSLARIQSQPPLPTPTPSSSLPPLTPRVQTGTPV